MSNRLILSTWIVFLILMVSCRPVTSQEVTANQALPVLASTPFLADITQNVAGDRLVVESLIPLGVDPHVFEPTPQDVAKISNSKVLVINGAGFEEFLDNLIQHTQGERFLIEASHGLTMREFHDDEHEDSDIHEDENDHDEEKYEDEHGHDHEGDPHFWLNPLFTIHYVENIRDGLSEVDPEGRDIYAENAAAYIARLQDLDNWIMEEISQVPPERRLLVTNHDSFGYFADRYGFEVIGTIIPSVHSGASPSPQELTRLVEQIRSTGAPAIFLETGTNPRLAEQIARETGSILAPPLYSHSPSTASGQAPGYISMMEYNTRVVVEALK
jgi:ABC-type Zn uptake system ZnuABC Zn-binding protein ZnuA